MEYDSQITPQFVNVFVVDVGQVMATHLTAAAGQGQISIEAAQQRTLARTGFTDEVDQFPGCTVRLTACRTACSAWEMLPFSMRIRGEALFPFKLFFVDPCTRED